MDNAANEKEVKRRQAVWLDREVERRAVYESLSATRQGRNFLSWLLDISMCEADCYTGNSQTFFNLGARYVGQRVKSELITHCPDGYLQILKEINEDANPSPTSKE